jgi:hypothetical protein
VLKPVSVVLVVGASVSLEREMVQLVLMVLRWMRREGMVDLDARLEGWKVRERGLLVERMLRLAVLETLRVGLVEVAEVSGLEMEKMEGWLLRPVVVPLAD